MASSLSCCRSFEPCSWIPRRVPSSSACEASCARSAACELSSFSFMADISTFATSSSHIFASRLAAAVVDKTSTWFDRSRQPGAGAASFEPRPPDSGRSWARAPWRAVQTSPSRSSVAAICARAASSSARDVEASAFDSSAICWAATDSPNADSLAAASLQAVSRARRRSSETSLMRRRCRVMIEDRVSSVSATFTAHTDRFPGPTTQEE